MNERAKIDVVTVGETMALFRAWEDGPLSYAPLYTRTIAGAESNVAIALARLGRSARWISRLGQDPFGDLVLHTLAGEGVDVSHVQREADAATALFFREFKGYGEPHAFYYRKGSAASRLSPSDVTPGWLEDARHLHVTGITPALSATARQMTRELMQRARLQGLTVSLDPNLRRKLWSEEEARAELLELAGWCDILMPGRDEAQMLAGSKEPEECGRRLLSLGPRLIAIKLGEAGSLAVTQEETVSEKGWPVERVIDPIGAGDAFAAGLLTGLLEENALESEIYTAPLLAGALRLANCMGALATQFKGDWEGLPTRGELQAVCEGTVTVTR